MPAKQKKDQPKSISAFKANSFVLDLFDGSLALPNISPTILINRLDFKPSVSNTRYYQKTKNYIQKKKKKPFVINQRENSIDGPKTKFSLIMSSLEKCIRLITSPDLFRNVS